LTFCVCVVCLVLAVIGTINN